MPEPSVRIRMYRQGLGDCFLLAFPRPAGAADFFMLVDCGVLQGTDTAKIIEAVQDIKTTTGGHLDLVVMTHEHEDHISGFRQAADIFKDISVGQMWLAWTEDPENPVAVQLRKDKAVRVKAIQAAQAQLEQMNLEHLAVRDQERITEQKVAIQQMMRFFEKAPGKPATDPAGLAAAGQAAPDVPDNPMLRFARDKGVDPLFCYPTREGRQHIQEIIPGVRAYIFGPPEDSTIFTFMNPTKKGAETYSSQAFGLEDGIITAIGDNPQAGGLASPQYPFDDLYQVSAEDAQIPPFGHFFRQHYGFHKSDPENYRRIDADWLDVASEMALKLVDGTNNTSLVLAVELGSPGEGKVVLLAADAQVGNWLSWGPLHWSFPTSSGGTKMVTTKDLLGRTVLYKVGHHGSDNATLRAMGLELMVNESLAAMLPVDENVAAHVNGANKPGWKMPAPELYARLKEKTKGRVLRADLGLPSRADAGKLSDEEWQAFSNAASKTDIYIEYEIY